MGKKKWRDNWFYEYLVGEKERMELVGLMYFLPKLTKMFYSWIENKIEEKTITNIRTKKPLYMVQTMWKPQCNGFFFFFFCLFSYSFILFFISFDFLLFFLGCCLFQVLFIHSKSFFFFICFGFLFLVHHFFVSL